MAYRQRWLGVLGEQGTAHKKKFLVKNIKDHVSHDLFIYGQVREEMESNGCQIKIGCEVNSISKSNGGRFVVPYI